MRDLVLKLDLCANPRQHDIRVRNSQHILKLIKHKACLPVLCMGGYHVKDFLKRINAGVPLQINRQRGRTRIAVYRQNRPQTGNEARGLS